MSLGLLLPLAVAAGIAGWLEARMVSPGPRPSTADDLAGLRARARALGLAARLDRPLVQASLVMVAPALLTYLTVHIGQVAYVLFAVPPALLLAGPALTALAARLGRGPGTAAGLLAGCVVFNLAYFVTPLGGFAALVAERDHLAAGELRLVRSQPAAGVVLLTDPEGPSSYRTAMYYLPEWATVAVGRDERGRAGEFFSSTGPGPDYNLDRFKHIASLSLPSGVTALVLDRAVLRSIGDPDRLGVIVGPVTAWSIPLLQADPPLAFGSWIYLRGSDCPCRGAGSRPPTSRHQIPQ